MPRGSAAMARISRSLLRAGGLGPTTDNPSNPRSLRMACNSRRHEAQVSRCCSNSWSSSPCSSLSAYSANSSANCSCVLIGSNYANLVRKACSPLRMRVLIVPSGAPVFSAISTCVSPWKYASSSALR